MFSLKTYIELLKCVIVYFILMTWMHSKLDIFTFFSYHVLGFSIMS